MAGRSGERAAGRRTGISIEEHGAQYLSHGDVIGICFLLLCRTQSKSTNMKSKEGNGRNDPGNSDFPRCT